MRRLLLLGLAFCGTAHAITQPRIDLEVTSAWKGWTRPGRATELDIRLIADTATRVTLDVVAGRQSVRTDLDLQPGRVVRLYVPVSVAEGVAVSVWSPAGPPKRHDISIAQAESPLLVVGLATDDLVQLDGFHTVAIAADNLPRNSSAYSSIDALILDAQTLGALDQRQLSALLAHAAACGRIVVLNTDPGVRRVLDSSGGCGGHALMSAASLMEAKEMLKSSLAANMPPAMPLGAVSGFARPSIVIWNRVAIGAAVYFAVAALVLMLFASLPVLVLTPALTSVAVLALLHAVQPSSQLFVWSEGESGAQTARYQAWQWFPGLVRERTRVPIPPQLASSTQPCEPAQAMRFEFDASREHVTFAEFETRLFRQVSLCYSGSFPMTRGVAIEAGPDGSRNLRNTGTKAWPHGALLSGGLVQDLPALGPGAQVTIGVHSGKPPRDAAAQTAMTRTQAGGVAALWELDLGGVASVPIESRGWLLVSIPPP